MGIFWVMGVILVCGMIILYTTKESERQNHRLKQCCRDLIAGLHFGPYDKTQHLAMIDHLLRPTDLIMVLRCKDDIPEIGLVKDIGWDDVYKFAIIRKGQPVRRPGEPTTEDNTP